MNTDRRTFLVGTGAATVALLAAVATGCAPMPTPSTPGPDLITNGSFEADPTGRTISGWTVTS